MIINPDKSTEEEDDDVNFKKNNVIYSLFYYH